MDQECAELLAEAIELVRDRPCRRPECIAGESDEPSHRLCQRIRVFVDQAEAHLADAG